MYDPAALRSMRFSARSLMRRTSAPSTSHDSVLKFLYRPPCDRVTKPDCPPEPRLTSDAGAAGAGGVACGPEGVVGSAVGPACTGPLVGCSVGAVGGASGGAVGSPAGGCPCAGSGCGCGCGAGCCA